MQAPIRVRGNFLYAFSRASNFEVGWTSKGVQYNAGVKLWLADKIWWELSCDDWEHRWSQGWCSEGGTWPISMYQHFQHTATVVQRTKPGRPQISAYNYFTKPTSTCTGLYRRKTLGSLLHVSARHECHHQGVHSVAKIGTSKWPVAQ